MLGYRLAALNARMLISRNPVTSSVTVKAYARTASNVSIKPPIALYGVDGTYANALYIAAVKSSALESTTKTVENLSIVFQKDPKLSTILHSPAFSPADRKRIVGELQKHVGVCNEIFKNFLNTLAENNRLGMLERVVSKFAQLASAHRGEVELVITSAVVSIDKVDQELEAIGALTSAQPLDNKVLEQLKTNMSKSKYVSQGQKLKVIPKVNPDILGGLIIDINGWTIDSSVSAKMAKLNKLLRDQL